MKRIFRSALALLLIFTLSACSSAPVTPIQSAMNQIGKPILDAYEAMGLPGEPIDASRGDILLLAIDGVELCGRSGAVVLFLDGDVKVSDNPPLSRVEYNFLLHNPTEKDGQFAIDLSAYLSELYGETKPPEYYPSFSETAAGDFFTEAVPDAVRDIWVTENEMQIALTARLMPPENTTDGIETLFVSLAISEYVDLNA